MVNADLLAGGLTTIHQPIEEMGVQSVHFLAALMKGAPVKKCVPFYFAHAPRRAQHDSAHSGSVT